jgi:ATP-dependent Clp protease ATP-binding subunit ClpA
MTSRAITPRQLARAAIKDLRRHIVLSPELETKIERAFERVAPYAQERSRHERNAHPLTAEECRQRGQRAEHGILPPYTGAADEIRTLMKLADRKK